MKKIEAKIVADSISPQGHRITSMLLTYPRFIHGEVMTHRMFSRNSASSRAIPFEKMVKMVEEDPFVPIAWQKDHKGMQGTDYITDEVDLELNINAWLRARDNAVLNAKYLNHGVVEGRNNGVAKQLCNRLLEPFMWHTVLVTATEFENFFELRCPKYEFYGQLKGVGLPVQHFKSKKDYCKIAGGNPDEIAPEFWFYKNKSQAEIHIQALAESMWDAMSESTPNPLEAGEWHIPFGDKIDDAELLNNVSTPEWLSRGVKLEGERIKIATARCARLSYMTHDGEIDYAKDIRLHDDLLKNRHMSPFEHCARVMSEEEYENYFKVFGLNDGDIEYGWCNNFRGWIQYRHIIE